MGVATGEQRLLNLDRESGVQVTVEGGVSGPRERYVLTSEDLQGRVLELNGTALAAGPDGSPPDLEPRIASGGSTSSIVKLPPASYAFVVLPEAGATACR